jgi:hypothetical protein
LEDKIKNNKKIIRFTPLSRKIPTRPSTSQRTTPSKNVIIGGCNLEEEA